MTPARIKLFLDDLDKQITESWNNTVKIRSLANLLRMELSVHSDLSRILKFSASDMHAIPPIQQQAIAQCLINQGLAHFDRAWFEFGTSGTVMLQFKTIVIGVEPDGYTHS